MNERSIPTDSLINVNSNLKWDQLLDLKNKLVLIVDDEKDLREIIRYNLEQEGINSIQASNGDKAIESLSQNPSLI